MYTMCIIKLLYIGNNNAYFVNSNPLRALQSELNENILHHPAIRFETL